MSLCGINNSIPAQASSAIGCGPFVEYIDPLLYRKFYFSVSRAGMATIEGPSGAGGISEAFPIQQKKRTIERLVVLCVNIAPCECSEEVRFLRALLQKGGWSPKKDAAIMQSIVKLVKKSGVAAVSNA